jgi:beta-phosphoglucomutase-like phosphatase (HAD superfamily)
MRPGLVIFDCDGTLVDSEVLGNQVMVELAIEHGLQLTLEDAMEHFKGVKMAEAVAEIERRLGRALPEDFVPRIRQRTAEAFEASLLEVPGAKDLVSSVTTAKCVASAGPRAKIELGLSVTGLLPYFKDGEEPHLQFVRGRRLEAGSRPLPARSRGDGL